MEHAIAYVPPMFPHSITVVREALTLRLRWCDTIWGSHLWRTIQGVILKEFPMPFVLIEFIIVGLFYAGFWASGNEHVRDRNAP